MRRETAASSPHAALPTPHPSPLDHLPIRNEWVHAFTNVVQGTVGPDCLGAANGIEQLAGRLNTLPPPRTRVEQLLARGLLWEWVARSSSRGVPEESQLVARLLSAWRGTDIVPSANEATPAAITIAASSCRAGDTVDQLARDSGLSRSEFYLKFKLAGGRTPHQYLEACRIFHAALELLRDTMKIDAIATMLGYRSYATFYRAFVRVIGIALEEFRRTAGVQAHTARHFAAHRCPLLCNAVDATTRCPIRPLMTPVVRRQS